MNTTTQRIAVGALATLLTGGLVACGSVAPAPRQQVDIVEAPAANVPQVESGFGPRKEHWATATDGPTADAYGESGFGPKRDIYGESGFGPRR
jgi:hypothetical protein